MPGSPPDSEDVRTRGERLRAYPFGWLLSSGHAFRILSSESGLPERSEKSDWAAFPHRRRSQRRGRTRLPAAVSRDRRPPKYAQGPAQLWRLGPLPSTNSRSRRPIRDRVRERAARRARLPRSRRNSARGPTRGRTRSRLHSGATEPAGRAFCDFDHASRTALPRQQTMRATIGANHGHAARSTRYDFRRSLDACATRLFFALSLTADRQHRRRAMPVISVPERGRKPRWTRCRRAAKFQLSN